MQAIWKYELQLDGGPQGLFLPEGSLPLTVQVQGQAPLGCAHRVCLWAQVDPLKSVTLRSFKFVGTGQEEISATDTYIGTIQLHNGRLVLHLYEILEKEPT